MGFMELYHVCVIVLLCFVFCNFNSHCCNLDSNPFYHHTLILEQASCLCMWCLYIYIYYSMHIFWGYVFSQDAACLEACSDQGLDQETVLLYSKLLYMFNDVVQVGSIVYNVFSFVVFMFRRFKIESLKLVLVS